jgi:hypothetical protein
MRQGGEPRVEERTGDHRGRRGRPQVKSRKTGGVGGGRRWSRPRGLERADHGRDGAGRVEQGRDGSDPIRSEQDDGRAWPIPGGCGRRAGDDRGRSNRAGARGRGQGRSSRSRKRWRQRPDAVAESRDGRRLRQREERNLAL